MGETSWEPTYREPGCYSRVINRSSSIVCAESGFGKMRLMGTAHVDALESSVSATLVLGKDNAYKNLDRLVRDAVADSLWSLLKGQPSTIAQLTRLPNKSYLMPRIKRMLREWMEPQGDDVNDQLDWLASHHPSLADAISELAVIARQEIPSTSIMSLCRDLNACARGLFPHDETPSTYLWIYVQDDFDWPAQGEALRNLVNACARSEFNIWVKVFITPAGLKRLDSMQIDSQIARIGLAWESGLLEVLADGICKDRVNISFAQLIDAKRFNRFRDNYPGMIPPAPGAWLSLAHIASGLAEQYGCRVLSEDHWLDALTEYCRVYRRLQLKDGRVHAFGREVELDPIDLEVLQVIHQWCNNPEKQKLAARPSAKQIVTEINQQRKTQGRRIIKDNAVFTSIHRIRTNPHFEPAYHRVYRKPNVQDEQWLVYLKNENGYFLDQFDL